VQAFPSLHVVPFAAVGFEQMPVAELQMPATWHWSEAVQVVKTPMHVPLRQKSPWVHRLPSEHAVPSVAVGFEQTPLVGSQVPATWHASLAVQTTGLLPVQTPLWQVSVWVHALPSLHVVPSVASGLEHVPVLGLHVPAT
jgi:hypothetical protein